MVTSVSYIYFLSLIRLKTIA